MQLLFVILKAMPVAVGFLDNNFTLFDKPIKDSVYVEFFAGLAFLKSYYKVLEIEEYG